MSEPKKPCRLLRTKSGFGAVVGGGIPQTADDETQVYWCLNTMESFGPDENFAHAHTCAQGRVCWQPPSEDEDLA